MVAAPPDFVQVLFDQPVRAVAAGLVDCSGAAVRCAVHEHGDRLVIVPDGPLMKRCAILATWRVVDLEGMEHPGALSFQVGASPGPGGSLSLNAETASTETPIVAMLGSARPGLISLRLATSAVRGQVWWTHAQASAPLAWQADRLRGALVARGILPCPGEWSMRARLSNWDGSTIDLESTAMVESRTRSADGP